MKGEKFEIELTDGTKKEATFVTRIKSEEKNTEYKNSQGAFYFYGISDYTDTIFDKYFN